MYPRQVNGGRPQVEFGRRFLDEVSTIGFFLSLSFLPFLLLVCIRARNFVSRDRKKRSNRNLREIPITSFVRRREFLPSAETAANFAPDERPLSIFGESCPVARRRISEGVSRQFSARLDIFEDCVA